MKAGLAGYLSLARKAGVLFTGQKKVEEMVRGNAAALLFLAADSEGEGKRKLLQIVEKLSPETLVYVVFNSDELDEITGGVNTVHMGLAESGIASNIAAAAGKVEKFSRCT